MDLLRKRLKSIFIAVNKWNFTRKNAFYYTLQKVYNLVGFFGGDLDWHKKHECFK